MCYKCVAAQRMCIFRLSHVCAPQRKRHVNLGLPTPFNIKGIKMTYSGMEQLLQECHEWLREGWGFPSRLCDYVAFTPVPPGWAI